MSLSDSLALSPMRRAGSCRSAMAMIFDPLPRFVLPTQAPPPALASATLPSMNASCKSR